MVAKLRIKRQQNPRCGGGKLFIGWFKSQVQKTIKDHIAELIVKENWPVMKVSSGAYTEEIEQFTIGAVRKHVESYGVEIVRFDDREIVIDLSQPNPAMLRCDVVLERAINHLRALYTLKVLNDWGVPDRKSVV